MRDLWEMDDRQLWGRGLYRYEVVRSCLCGTSHQWWGVPYGGWTDQNGLVVKCLNERNS